MARPDVPCSQFRFSHDGHFGLGAFIGQSALGWPRLPHGFHRLPSCREQRPRGKQRAAGNTRPANGSSTPGPARPGMKGKRRKCRGAARHACHTAQAPTDSAGPIKTGTRPVTSTACQCLIARGIRRTAVKSRRRSVNEIWAIYCWQLAVDRPRVGGGGLTLVAR